MSTKTEERLKKLLDDQHEKNKTVINDSIGGVFLYGVIVGIIISYSGFSWVYCWCWEWYSVGK